MIPNLKQISVENIYIYANAISNSATHQSKHNYPRLSKGAACQTIQR
jgi:hypothetical protein